MSGVEAAGLVLAAFPLLISGLEHYANGAEAIRRAWNYSREFKSLARKLETEKTIFQNAIEILLDDCVDIGTQQKLMEDIGGKLWSQPSVESTLRQRLRGSFKSYVECVRGISDTITQLQKQLKLGPNSKVCGALRSYGKNKVTFQLLSITNFTRYRIMTANHFARHIRVSILQSEIQSTKSSSEISRMITWL